STTQDPTTDGESGPTDTDSDTGSTGTTSADTGSSSSTGDDILTVSELVAGDLVITEVMANPNCLGDNCEWFELSNTTPFDIDLLNLGIGDRDDYDNEAPGTFITVSAVLPAGELGIIAREDLWPYDEEPLARYSNAVQFSNTSFERVVVFSGVDVLDVTATFLPNEQPGRSRMLLSASWDSEDHTDSDDWCWSNTVLPSTSTSDDWGTPGSDTIDCLPPA
ncbi:MAG: lamin tail domain-containing protein, partial [Nannocystaceae bacterium]|nr:lamin tail domain-containing protein [Nannocystaceae bacterium]